MIPKLEVAGSIPVARSFSTLALSRLVVFTQAINFPQQFDFFTQFDFLTRLPASNIVWPVLYSLNEAPRPQGKMSAPHLHFDDHSIHQNRER